MLALLLSTALAGHTLDFTYVRDLLPHQGWPALEGVVTGVVVEGGDHKWGTPVGWTGFYDRPNFCAYRFSTDGAAPWAVYFEDEVGVGDNHLEGWTAGSAWETGLDASMMCSKNAGGYGLSGPVHVVRVEVNHGEPVRSNLHFVITEATRLDGSKALPMDPHQALIDARKHFNAGVRERAPVMDALMAKGERDGKRASEEVDAEAFDGGPEVRVFPTWDTENSALVATFVYTHTVGRQFTTTEMVSTRCPPGAPCVPPRPNRVTRTWVWGVEVAATYTLGADGQITSVQWHEPRAARDF